MKQDFLIALTVALGPTIVGIYNVFKSKQIHALVNSRMTEVLNQLADALRRVKLLEGALIKGIPGKALPESPPFIHKKRATDP